MCKPDDEQILALQAENRIICEQLRVSYEALRSLRHLPPSQAAQIIKLKRVDSTFLSEVVQW